MIFGLNLLLIPYFGIMGAAVTTLISSSFVSITTSHYSRRRMKFDLAPRFIFKSITALPAMVAVILGLDFRNTFGLSLLRALVLSCTLCLYLL